MAPAFLKSFYILLEGTYMNQLTKLSLSAVFLSTSALAQQSTLNVYTYSSFASEYGPAKQLEANFEKTCQCDLRFLPFDDGITMFNRVRLEGKKTKADVVLGIDSFLKDEAEKAGLFTAHELSLDSIAIPTNNWKSEVFYPFDYGEYAFIYNKDKLKNPPTSMKALIERTDLRVIYQDPRTSTVGRGLLMWVNALYGEQGEQAVAERWAALSKHTVTVGKGWSETYGAYLKGEADLALSYTTSPLYHQWYENDDKNVAAIFDEGHLVQVEYGAIMQSSKQKALAQKFLQFLTTPESQKIIAKANIMHPVIAEEVDPLLSALPKTKTLTNFAMPSSEQVRQWLNIWQKAITQ